MIIQRRGFLVGLASMLSFVIPAPAIVRAASIMPVKAIDDSINLYGAFEELLRRDSLRPLIFKISEPGTSDTLPIFGSFVERLGTPDIWTQCW